MTPVIGTPSKGKSKEDAIWNCGWWDFQPLSDHPRKPVEWSNSSVIFTAHALQPIILARHFSSSKQFSMPPPPPLLSNSSIYDPPTIITASPDDRWLFAFFPSKGKDGLCCLWQRGIELDNWSVQEWWTFASNAGVVVANWLGGPREWTIDSVTGVPTRLPARGPSTPVSSPTLLFVTQDHRLIVCYLRYYVPTLKMFSCSLLQHSAASERQPDNSQSPLDDVGSVKICINAAIGITYGDPSILIAMRSQVFPLTSSSPTPDQFPLDLGLSLDMEPDLAESYPTAQEDYMEESIIEICEVQLLFDGMVMIGTSKKIPAIENAPGRLKELCFVCQPPMKERSQSTVNLIATFLDFNNYMSLPRSSMKCYPFNKSVSGSAGERVSWIVQPEVIRDFDSGILAHVMPSQPVHCDHGVYISIYDTAGTQPRQKLKHAEITIGHIKMLKIPELTDDETWEVTPIISPLHRIGREVPIDAVLSPNQNLLCALFQSPWSSQMSIQKVPRHPGSFSDTSIPPFALALVVATISNRSTDDLTHALSQPSMPPNEVTEVLYHAFTLLDRHSSGDFASQLGLTIESYRSRALRVLNVVDKDRVDTKWRTAHDMISVAACNAIFNDCTDGEEYQTELVWQMIDLSGWIMSLLEMLVKECILSSDFSDPESFAVFSGAQTTRVLDSPVFLHLVHPKALQNLRVALSHVKQFQTYLAGLTPRTENAQLSREVLLDLVECSGIDIPGLDTILEKLSKSIQGFNDAEVRKSLAACQPSASLQVPLRETVNSMSQSAALNKARLFVKSFEMVDGQPHTPVDYPPKDKSKDVVSKGLLLHRARGMNCLRCGGQTEYGKDPMALKSILVWEKSWSRRCVCGGSWTRIDS